MVDALVSGINGRKAVQVRVLSWAEKAIADYAIAFFVPLQQSYLPCKLLGPRVFEYELLQFREHREDHFKDSSFIA